MSTPAVFRAIWPITDETVPFADLIAAARADLPLLTAQARCCLAGRGRFSIDRSVDVPGSGRVAPTCLIYDAPALPADARAYHRRSAA